MNRGAGGGSVPARCVGSHQCQLGRLVRKVQQRLLMDPLCRRRKSDLRGCFILPVACAYGKKSMVKEPLWQVWHYESPSPESLMKISAFLFIRVFTECCKTGEEQNLIWGNHRVVGGNIFVWECSRQDVIFESLTGHLRSLAADHRDLNEGRSSFPAAFLLGTGQFHQQLFVPETL